jgi:hypothetical protein
MPMLEEGAWPGARGAPPRLDPVTLDRVSIFSLVPFREAASPWRHMRRLVTIANRFSAPAENNRVYLRVRVIFVFGSRNYERIGSSVSLA